jgi:hypothetical protein
MKKFKKLIIPFTAIAAAVVVAPISEVVAADSQLPFNSVIIGGQAFDLDYVNDPANVAEIRALIVASHAEIFVKASNGTWYTNTEERLTPAEIRKLPAVTYKAPNGTKMEIPAGDGAGEAAIEVVDVKAITQTITANKVTDLKFSVNASEELTKADFEEKYEGYTVEFKYNFLSPTPAETAGKVNKSANFKYAVQVTDSEGNKLPEELAPTDFVDVTVVDGIKAVKVSKISLVSDGKKWEVSSVTKTDNVTIEATLFENYFGESNLDEDSSVAQPTIKTVTSSNPAVAYYDNGIEVLTAGTVTFTVEFNGIEGTKTIQVTTKAPQELSSIKADAQKVQANLDGQVVKFAILDKDAQEMRTPATVYYTVTAEGKTETTDPATEKTGTGSATITANFVKGLNTVNVYKEAAKTNKIGTFTVQAVDVANVAPDTYKLVVGKIESVDQKALDLNPDDEKNSKELIVTVEAYVDGVKVNLPTTVEYEVISSDNKVATVDKVGSQVKVTALSKGTTTVTLRTVEGAIKTPVATYGVTVNNTTPQITSLVLKASDEGKIKVNKANNNLTGLTVAVLAAVVDGEKLPVGAIEKVTAIDSDNVVIVKIGDLYGGKSFTLAADVDLKDPTLSNAKVGTVAATVDGTTLTFTVDSATSYKTGSVTLSEDVSVDVDFKNNGTNEVNGIEITSSTNLVQLALDTLAILEGTTTADGVTGQTLLDNSEVVITLTDKVGNVSEYTIKFVAPVQ